MSIEKPGDDYSDFELEQQRENAKGDFWEFEQENAQEARKLTVERLHQFFAVYQTTQAPLSRKVLRGHMMWPPVVYDDDSSMALVDSDDHLDKHEVIPTKSIVLVPNPLFKKRKGKEKLKLTIPLDQEKQLAHSVVVTDFDETGDFNKYIINEAGVWIWLNADKCKEAGIKFDPEEEGLYIDVDLFKIDEIARDEELPAPSIEITRYLSRKIHYWTGAVQRTITFKGDDIQNTDL